MNCKKCGEAFEPIQKTQVYCSPRCRENAYARRWYANKHQDQALLSTPCTWCGGPKPQSRQTCSSKCASDRARYRGYGINSLAELTVLKDRSSGRCEICGVIEEEAPRGVLHCDHDHKTGKARGMLCMHCNQALGKFRDDISLLSAAVVYLSTR